MSKRRAILILPVFAVAAVVFTLLLASKGSNGPPSRPDPAPHGPSGHTVPAPLADGTGAVKPGVEAEAAASASEETEPSLPLVVRVVNALTGEVVGAQRVVRIHNDRFPNRGAADQLVRHGDEFVLEDTPFRHGKNAIAVLEVEPPPGFVAGPASPPRDRVSRDAESLSATVLVWPELPVRIVALDASGPVEGALVGGVQFEDLPLRAEAPLTSKDGRTTLRGVPNIPRERLTVSVYRPSAPGREGAESAEASAIIEHGVEELTLTFRDWEEPGEFSSWPKDPHIGIGGGRSDPPPDLLRTAEVTVAVRDREGLPAVDVLVVIKDLLGYHKVHTGPDGIAEFTNCVPGPGEASVRETGFLFGEPDGFLLVDGKAAEVLLTEEAGRDLAVRVLDDTGVGVAGATVEAGSYFGIPWVSVRDGVQMLNLVTGPDGWVLLRDFPSGEVTISASCGSRHVNGETGPANDLVLTLPSR